MKKKHPLKIDLLAFLKTGKFDCIELGQKKSWVLDNFPDPDENYYSSQSNEFEIFSYGAVEFHFRKEILYLVFSDYINHKGNKKTFYTGKAFKFINQSFFGKKGKSLKLPYVLSSLVQERVGYTVAWSKHGFNAVEIMTEGGVSLLFEDSKSDTDNIKCFQLVALSFYNEKYAAPA